MAKLSKKKVWDREFEIWYYKWEFLRRNKEFLKDFKPLQSYISKLNFPRIGKYRRSKNPSKKEAEKFMKDTFGSMKTFSKNLQLYFDLSKKWEMPGFILPSLDLKTAVSYFSKFKNVVNLEANLPYFIFLIFGMLRGAQESYLGMNPILPVTFAIPAIQDYRVKDPYRLDLTLNLKFPKTVIMNFVEFWVDISKKTRGKKEDVRARLSEYGDYLKIYDLRQLGKSWRNIAPKVYRSNIDLDTARRKCMSGYDRCVNLINGGYKDIK